MPLYRFKALAPILIITICVIFSTRASADLAKAPVWKAWYVVKTKDGTAVQYYKDEVNHTQGKLHFTNEIWKKEEGYINEEHLGAFSEDSESLKPLFYNLKSAYRSSELQIDGTIQPDGTLVVKIQKDGKTLPPVKSMPSKQAFFSSFFPVWLSIQLKTLKENESKTFYAIQEDDIESRFMTVIGRVKLEKPDELAIQTKTKKISVNYRDLPSTWWVDAKGIATRIEMKTNGLIVSKVSEAEAKNSLKK